MNINRGAIYDVDSRVTCSGGAVSAFFRMDDEDGMRIDTITNINTPATLLHRRLGGADADAFFHNRVSTRDNNRILRFTARRANFVIEGDEQAGFIRHVGLVGGEASILLDDVTVTTRDHGAGALTNEGQFIALRIDMAQRSFGNVTIRGAVVKSYTAATMSLLRVSRRPNPSGDLQADVESFIVDLQDSEFELEASLGCSSQAVSRVISLEMNERISSSVYMDNVRVVGRNTDLSKLSGGTNTKCDVGGVTGLHLGLSSAVTQLPVQLSRLNVAVSSSWGPTAVVATFFDKIAFLLRDSTLRAVAVGNATAVQTRIVDLPTSMTNSTFALVRVDMSGSTVASPGPCIGGRSGAPSGIATTAVYLYNNTFGACPNGRFPSKHVGLQFSLDSPFESRCNFDAVAKTVLDSSNISDKVTSTKQCNAECQFKYECNSRFGASVVSATGAPDSCQCVCNTPSTKFTTFDARCDPVTMWATPTQEVFAPTVTLTLPERWRTVTHTLIPPSPLTTPAVTHATTAPTILTTGQPTTSRVTTTKPPTTTARPPNTTAVSTTKPPVTQRHHTETLLPTPQPPPVTAAPLIEKPAAKSEAVQNVIAAALPPAAAAGVAATSTSAVAVGGAVNPSAANKGANMANILGTVDCAFSDDSLETSAVEVLWVTELGASEFRYLVGGATTSLAFIYLAYAVQFALYALAKDYYMLRRCAAAFGALVISFMMPNVASYATTMAVHASSSAIQGFAVIAWTLTAAAFFGPLYVVLTRTPGTIPVEDFATLAPNVFYPFLVLADGCRDTTVLLLRLHFFEDLLIALVMGALGGWQPTNIDCGIVTLLMAIVAALHLLYVIIKHPFAEHVDTVFAVVIGGGQLVLAIGTYIVIRTGSGVAALGYLALAMGASFVVQTVVTTAFGVSQFFHRRLKRKLKEQQRKSKAVESALTVPILGAAADAHGSSGSGAAANGWTLPPRPRGGDHVTSSSNVSNGSASAGDGNVTERPRQNPLAHNAIPPPPPVYIDEL
jgi:hypothetical protein